MRFDLIEIIDAWFTAMNPDETQSNLAKERLDVCMKCDLRKEVIHNKEWSAFCGGCGCPIRSKIFTDQFGSCPEKKWDSLEENYRSMLKQKSRTII
jgi:hypothetical protein